MDEKNSIKIKKIELNPDPRFPNQKPKIKLKVVDTYRDIFFNDRPITNIYLDDICNELVLWAKENDEALLLSQYFLEKGLSQSTVDKWSRDFPKFKQAKETAKNFIANRREIKALNNKINTAVYLRTHYLYDDNWWKMSERLAKIKANAENPNKDTKYTVIVDSYKNLEEFNASKKQKTSLLKEHLPEMGNIDED
jgi:hypothetical protein